MTNTEMCGQQAEARSPLGSLTTKGRVSRSSRERLEGRGEGNGAP